MAYDPPGNISSSVDFFSWINSSVGDFFFPGTIIAVYFILIVKMMYNPGTNTSQAFAAASFICMILTVFLRVVNVVNNAFMVIFIILTAIGAVWMHTENAKFG